MSNSHEDLVAFVLGELDETATQKIQNDKGQEAEIAEIEAHLALHDACPEIEPAPALWNRIEEQVRAEPVRRGFFRRWATPLAAAALILAALFVPKDWNPPWAERAAVTPTFGDATASGDVWTADGVCRLQLGTDVILTMDDGTVVRTLSNQRLALKAGRLFVEVAPGAAGFIVESGAARLVTLGTRFLVDGRNNDAPLLHVTEGRVRYEFDGGSAHVRAGSTYAPYPVPSLKPGAETAWFRRPGFTAQILDNDRIRVVLRNEMPDPIELAPPTGGEPFCYASYQNHNYPLTPAGVETVRVLQPGDSLTFELPLPAPVEKGQPLSVLIPGVGSAEATR
jgi:ferric-dicitrate binding protein FerR (iron transport regulator)